jgi:hypothetical protein
MTPPRTGISLAHDLANYFDPPGRARSLQFIKRGAIPLVKFLTDPDRAFEVIASLD